MCFVLFFHFWTFFGGLVEELSSWHLVDHNGLIHKIINQTLIFLFKRRTLNLVSSTLCFLQRNRTLVDSAALFLEGFVTVDFIKLIIGYIGMYIWN